MRFLSFFFFALLFHTASLTAQIHDPVTWTYDQKQVDAETFDIIFKATIEDGWSVYSQYLANDDGPIRTSFTYDEGDHFSLVGKNVETSDHRKEGFDKIFEMEVIKFYEEVTMTQRVKIKDPSKPVTGYLEFMTCDATKCLPPTTKDFSFTLTPAKVTKEETGTGSVAPVPAAPVKEKVEKVVENPKPAAPSTSTKATTTTKVQEKKPTVSNSLGTTSTTSKQTTTTAATSPQPQATEEKPSAEVQTEEEAIVAAPESSSKGGILEPVKWNTTIKKVTDGEYDVIVQAKIDEGWHIYSQYLESDEGPIATSFLFDNPDSNLELVGKTQEDGPKKIKEFDKVFEMELTKFKKEAFFTQRIKTKDTKAPITGSLEFMTCEAGRCLPPAYVYFGASPESLKTFTGEEDGVKAFFGGGAIAAATPGRDGAIIDQARPVLQETYVSPVGDCGEEEIAKGSLLWTFVLGFLGGFLALLTPCVFPMIPLTVSYFTKSSKSKAAGIRNGLIYGLSIIVIYVSIGLLITGAFGADALNELSTNWIANTLFFVIFMFFAFSFFGYYELTLPSSWANKSDQMADRGGLIGTFFMAFTLALVSFSCTGPIIGSALVQSAVDPLGPFIVMLGFSSALALPFGLFAAFPAFLNALPSSGSWMNSVKVVLGFLEVALAFKFLSVADMTMGWNILGYEVFMGVWVLTFAGMTAYLFGFIKFPHDSPLKKLSPMRATLAVLSLAWTLYLCSGFMFNEKTQAYDSLSLMSGLAPPAHYNYFLPEPTPEKTIKDKYPSFTKCANNLDCFKDYYEGMAYAKETNQPVLLDFTGFGCVNCRKTEEHIWVEDKVWKKIAEDFVLISLYVDDRKKLKETLVSKNTNEKIRNVGNMWADFQIVNFEQNSQPLYVMVTPDEKVLAAPRGFKEGVDEYADFLNCGLDTYKKLSGGAVPGEVGKTIGAR